MKYYKCISLCLLAGVLLVTSGCQKAPEEVKERMEQYGSNKQMSDEELSYCSVSELREFDMEDLNVELDNMILPKKIDFSGVESIATLEMSLVDDYSQKAEQYAEVFGVDKELLISDEEYFQKVYEEAIASGIDLEKPDNTSENKGFICDDEELGIYFAIKDIGFISYDSGNSNDLRMDEIFVKGYAKELDLDVDDIQDETILFGDNEVNIKEMTDKAKLWLDENVSLEEGFQYKVTDAYVKELETDKGIEYMLSLGMDVSYKGVIFNNYASGMNDLICDADMTYDDEDTISSFSNGAIMQVDNSSEITEVINFETAVRLADTKVSGFNQNKITKVLPLYELKIKEGYEDVTDVSEFRYTATPVYAFLIKEEVTEENIDALGINKCNFYKYIFVDMVTGKVRAGLS